MRTEEEIIYTLHDIVRGAQINQDDPINERLMRQFLRIHRGKILNTYYNKAQSIPDECFQNLGSIYFNFLNGYYISPVLPKTIRFKNHTGLIMSKDGYPISILNSEEFDLSLKNKFNKKHPKAKFVENQLYLNIGEAVNCTQINNNPNSDLNKVVAKFNQEASLNIVNTHLIACLVNTDDSLGYNWTEHAYPMPDELIDELLSNIKSKDFQLFLQLNGDTTGNIKFDAKEQNPNR